MRIKVQICLLAYFIDPAIYRIVVCNLDLHITYHYLIILIGTHEG